MIKKKTIKDIEKLFEVSSIDIKKIKQNFHSEMKKGLSGKKSSLKMIPTYIERPLGTEKGEFLALDLGGTNFRVLSIKLKGNRHYDAPIIKKFSLKENHIKGTGRELFDFIADCIKSFIIKEKLSVEEKHNVGFAFSFPVKMKSRSSGILMRWTKGFKAKGVEGKDVIKLLNESLKRKGLINTKIVGLSNDTVSTLVAKSYEDKNCNMGVIIGTGTNACYSEKLSKIPKYKGAKTRSGEMIINMEWGGFNKLANTIFDKELDKLSLNPGEQRLEKMVSGMYLGEIIGILIKYFVEKNILFNKENKSVVKNPKNFKSEYMTIIEKDKSKNLSKTNILLKKLGIKNSNFEDRKTVKRICKIVTTRSAFIAATAIMAVLAKDDPNLSKRHTVAVDGSVYEKQTGYPEAMRKALKQFLKKKAKNIKLILVKDASGKGAAVVAAND